MEGFAGAAQNYQERLLAYRAAGKKRSAHLHLEKNRVILAYEQMQRNFHHELKMVTAQSRAKAPKGVPLSNVDRGLHIARSSRTPVKLNVMSQVQASNLMKLGKHANVFGTGLVAIDFGSRIGNIRNSYRTGENWEKELFVESSGFVAGAVVGTIAIDLGIPALEFLVLATPAGWIGLVALFGAGAVVAAVSAGSSTLIASYTKSLAEKKYDQIIQLVNRL